MEKQVSPEPIVHVLLCRKTKRVPKAVLEVGRCYNAMFYVAADRGGLRQLLREYPHIDLVVLGGAFQKEERAAMLHVIARNRPGVSLYARGKSGSSPTFARYLDKVLSLHLPRH